MKRNHCLTLVHVVILMATGSLAANAWQEQAASSDAYAVAKPGLAEITQGRVTSTISFLASDELAGRATGSEEFNIAASFVASRFRGAGLEGGGADGSFYHETKIAMTQVPSSSVIFTDADGKAIAQLGLLAAGAERFQYEGSLTKVDLSKELPSSGLDGVVSGNYSGDARGQRILSQVARMANALHTAGAKALVLGVAADSDLVSIAQEARSKPRTESPRGRVSIPILLVAESSLTADSIKLDIPPTITTEFPMRNVIGLIRGSDPDLADEAILYSAHLDHLGTRPGVGDGIFNGADDDATGVTAVLTLADAFGAMPKPKRTLIFMTFWGEESGLLGSKQFVSTPSWPLEKIVANVNIEMIGRPEPGANGKIWMTGWTESDLGALMQQASGPFGVEIFEHPKFSAQLYRASDNYSFVDKGVIAHSFSGGSLHADYHQPDDEWEKLEIPHMTRVIQGLFIGSLPMANGEVTPKKSAAK
jgi:Peptidase family M28